MNAPYKALLARRGNAITLLCLALLAAAVTLWVHMLEFPAWDNPAGVVRGEFIQGTHDAYTWLAGSKGVGINDDAALSQLTRFIADVTGFKPGNIGFFSPPIAASLVALIMVLWAWTLGGLEVGLLAGALAALAPGFYLRTRFGYYDTDMVTLLLPLTITWLAAHWISPHIRHDWLTPLRDLKHRNAHHGAEPPAPDTSRSFWWIVAAGALGQLSLPFHNRISMLNALVFTLIIAIGLYFGKPGMRPRLLLGACIFGTSAFLSWPGVLLGGLLAVFPRISPSRFATLSRLLWPAAVMCLLVALQSDVFGALWSGLSSLLGDYLKPVAETATRSGAGGKQSLTYPAIVQSVIEAANLPLSDVLRRLHPWLWVGLVGLSGFAAVVVFRPLALFLLPFALLCLASIKLGTRMSMFGGPAFALGLALPVWWLFRALVGGRRFEKPLALCFQLALTAVLVFPHVFMARSLTPTPIPMPDHALGLMELKSRSPQDAMVWTWWDYGYATNYYAEREVFADGARHGGKFVYALGTVMTSPSPMLASNIIALSDSYDGKPWLAWSEASPEDMRSLISSLTQKDLPGPSERKHYIVVSVEYLPLLPWITFFGSWDFTTQQGQHGVVRMAPRNTSINQQKGKILTPEGELAIRSLNVLSHERGGLLRYSKNAGPHAILLPEYQTMYLVDDLVYDSLAVQLLIANPDSERFSDTYGDYFSLVYEGFPLIRIYEVL